MEIVFSLELLYIYSLDCGYLNSYKVFVPKV